MKTQRQHDSAMQVFTTQLAPWIFDHLAMIVYYISELMVHNSKAKLKMDLTVSDLQFQIRIQCNKQR